MHIAVDIRSLLEPYMSGVGEYTYNVLKRILEADKENQYYLFYNIRHSVKTTPPLLRQGYGGQAAFNYPNVKIFGYKYPNRWLNLSMRFFGWPRIEKLTRLRPALAPPSSRLLGTSKAPGGYGGQVFWFPNFGFVNYNIKVPYILTVHDLSFERYPEFFTPVHRLWHKLIDCKKMARRAAKIIAVSENTKNDLVELYGVDEKKIEVIYEGVGEEYMMRELGDLEIEKLSPRGGLASGEEIKKLRDDANMLAVKEKYNLPEKFILFLGTIEPRKNIEAVIRAFDKISSQFTSYELLVAGGKGWRNEEIYKVYEQAKRKDKIKFIGYVDKADKPALYGLASLFVFPSIYEGFGLPPLEAMACGVPVIASNCSSLPEVVEDAGLLVDPYNVNELAEAMKVMLTDDPSASSGPSGQLRQEFIKKGFEQVKKFSWESCADKTLEVIKHTN